MPRKSAQKIQIIKSKGVPGSVDQTMSFTAVDRQIIESYRAALEGLAAYLGGAYELVLHSLEDLDHSVVAIFNGERTGRRVGSPVTDLALQMLERIQQDHNQDYITYYNRNRDGEPLKSTTIVIRGENRRIIGLLCINLYLNTPLMSVLDSLGMSNISSQISPTETLVEESDDLVSSLLENVRNAVHSDPDISPTNRNKEIISQLQDRGVFRLKNAVPLVAQQLGISKNTVYLHLRNRDKVH